MTNWRAVLIGFAASLVVGALGLAVPGVGQLLPGLVAGFVAGYLAGGSLGNGAWNGLLAGSIGAIVLTLVIALGAGLLGGLATMNPLGGLLGGAGVLAVGVFLVVVFGLESAVAGAIGAAMK